MARRRPSLAENRPVRAPPRTGRGPRGVHDHLFGVPADRAPANPVDYAAQGFSSGLVQAIAYSIGALSFGKTFRSRPRPDFPRAASPGAVFI
jgi:hypothetical protein